MGSAFSQELKATTNRSVYNKLYKHYLEHNGKIMCSRCRYHKGENDTNKWYGEHPDYKHSKYTEIITKYPNWKLISKNRKQWMSKKYKLKSMYWSHFDVWFDYIEI